MLTFGLAEGEAGADVEQIGPSPGLVDPARVRGHDRLVLAIDLQGDLIIRQWNDLTGGNWNGIAIEIRIPWIITN